MPQHETEAPKPMPVPEKGEKPKRITAKNPPGGSQTPGAKQRRRAERIANKKAG